MADIKLSHKIKNDEYTEYVYNTFDIQDREQTSVTIPMKIGDLDIGLTDSLDVSVYNLPSTFIDNH